MPRLAMQLPFEIFSARDVEAARKASGVAHSHDAAEALDWANFAAVFFLIPPQSQRSVSPPQWHREAAHNLRRAARKLGLSEPFDAVRDLNLAGTLADKIDRKSESTLELIRMTTGKADAAWPQRGIGLNKWDVARDAVMIAFAGLRLLSQVIDDNARSKRKSGPIEKPSAHLIKYLAVSFGEATGLKMPITIGIDSGKPSGKTLTFIRCMIDRMKARLRSPEIVRRVRSCLSTEELKAKIAELDKITDARIGAGIRVQRRNRKALFPGRFRTNRALGNKGDRS